MDNPEATELERRLSREQLLKLAAAAGGATLLGSRIDAGRAAVDLVGAESGRLQVLDWPGYGNDGGQSMFAAYVKAHPQNKPQFTVMTNESDALAKSTSKMSLQMLFQRITVKPSRRRAPSNVSHRVGG